MRPSNLLYNMALATLAKHAMSEAEAQALQQAYINATETGDLAARNAARAQWAQRGLSTAGTVAGNPAVQAGTQTAGHALKQYGTGVAKGLGRFALPVMGAAGALGGWAGSEGRPAGERIFEAGRGAVEGTVPGYNALIEAGRPTGSNPSFQYTAPRGPSTGPVTPKFFSE